MGKKRKKKEILYQSPVVGGDRKWESVTTPEIYLTTEKREEGVSHAAPRLVEGEGRGKKRAKTTRFLLKRKKKMMPLI